MNYKKLQSLTEDVLNVIYDRSARFGYNDWNLESAFSALGRTDDGSNGTAVLNRLIQRGWVTSRTTVRLQGDEFSISLTERGRYAAIQRLESSEPKSLVERLHAMHWATWGGMAAMLAAFASLLAALFAYEAL